MATEKNNTELYFEWWLEELKSEGLVLHYEREPKTFVIHDAVPIFYNQNKATKSFVKSWELFPTLVYTPDYAVTFSKKFINKLVGHVDVSGKEIIEYDFKDIGSVYQNTLYYTSQVDDDGNPIVLFDCKAPSSATQVSAKLGSTRDFKYVTRMMFERYNLIINKVVPVGMATSLFGKTFMPARYKFTDKNGKPRKLKPYESNFKKLAQYLEIKNITK